TANSWTSTSSGGSGIATGDESVGTDDFSGVNGVRGSNFDDFFYGSENPAQTAENFEGMGGDDWIDGGGGLDRVIYQLASDNTGIHVNLPRGSVDWGAEARDVH